MAAHDDELPVPIRRVYARCAEVAVQGGRVETALRGPPLRAAAGAAQPLRRHRRQHGHARTPRVAGSFRRIAASPRADRRGERGGGAVADRPHAARHGEDDAAGRGGRPRLRAGPRQDQGRWRDRAVPGARADTPRVRRWPAHATHAVLIPARRRRVRSATRSPRLSALTRGISLSTPSTRRYHCRKAPSSRPRQPPRASHGPRPLRRRAADTEGA